MTDKLRDPLLAVMNLPTHRETLFGMAEGPALYEGQRLYLKRSEVLVELAAALAAAPQPAPSHEDLLDKIDGLESELDSAVEVAIKRGAVEWGRLNYPNHPALKDAPQPDDEWPVIPDTPEERAYRKGWNEGMMAGHKLVPIDDPAAPHPAPAETDWGPDVGKEVLPAYQTTPADREALVDVVAEELRATLGTTEATWLAEDVADALLARGLRLPGPDQSDA